MIRKNKEAVMDERRPVVRAGRRYIVSRILRRNLELGPHLLLCIVDPHVVVSDAMVQTAEEDKTVFHHRACVSRTRRRTFSRNLSRPAQKFRVVQVQRVQVTESASLTCEREMWS